MHTTTKTPVSPWGGWDIFLWLFFWPLALARLIGRRAGWSAVSARLVATGITIALFCVMVGLAGMASTATTTASTTQIGEQASTTTTTEPADEPAEPAEDDGPKLTRGQENALESAESYLDGGSFSEQGLAHQLKFEQYDAADIDYAIEHVKADYNAEAVESAENYLDGMSFSKPELLRQLKFEKYTPAQAQQAVEQVY